MSVNIGHFDINADILFYNAANRVCLTSSGKTINPKVTTRNMLTYMMMIAPVAASKRQIPIRCNGQLTDDDTRRVYSNVM